MGVFSFRTRLGWILCLATVAVLCGGISEQAFSGGKINAYSADQVAIDPAGNVKHAGKIYVTSKKIRMDNLAPDGAGTFVMIFRRDKNIAWTLNPDKKLYMERPLNEKEMEQATNQLRESRNEKVLGTEKVNGFKCTKKEVETTVGVMGFKRTVKTTVWMSDRLDMPIRTKSVDGSMTELRKIKKGTPARKYFEIPKGYQKVSNMMELMAMDISERGKKPSKTADEGQQSDSAFPYKMPKKLKGLFGN